MSVSIAEILRGAALQAVPLTGECAGYLVLAAADQALTAPRQVDASELHLLDDGSVRAVGTRACSEVDAERDLRQLLDRLLSSASSVTPALLRAGRRLRSRHGPLLRDIERALIPVNRSAARLPSRAWNARLTARSRRSLDGGAAAPPSSAKTQRDLPPPSERSRCAVLSRSRGAAAGRRAGVGSIDRRYGVAGGGAGAAIPPRTRSISFLPPPLPTPLAMCESDSASRGRSLSEPAVSSKKRARSHRLTRGGRPPRHQRLRRRQPTVAEARHATPSATPPTTTPVSAPSCSVHEDAPTWRPP